MYTTRGPGNAYLFDRICVIFAPLFKDAENYHFLDVISVRFVF